MHYGAAYLGSTIFRLTTRQYTRTLPNIEWLIAKNYINVLDILARQQRMVLKRKDISFLLKKYLRNYVV